MNEKELVTRDAILDRIDRARQALAECKTVRDAKKIADVAHAAQIFAKRQGMAQEVIDDAYEIRVQAMIRLGEIRANSPKATGTRGQFIGPAKIAAPINQSPTNEELGITDRESADAQLLYEAQDLIEDKAQPLSKIVMTVRRLWRKHKRDKARRKALKVAPLPKGIIIGDFRDYADQVPDGSLSLIFTDPPYDRKAIQLFEPLGQFAADKLAEGGSLLCYVGHVQLPDALTMLSEHLRYWWTCARIHSGAQPKIRELGIMVGWRPILWFVKGTRHDTTDFITDTLFPLTAEKELHDWQQPVADADYFIRKLCPDDGLVCDPFLGAGTTAIAAKQLGRRWMGFEIDKQTAQIAAQRLNEQ